MSDPSRTDVLVLGAGPGGYTAAFRAADLGMSVTLVDRGERLGGVCLNVGCIPSKALLHAAKVLTDAEEGAAFGLSFGKASVDLDALRTATADVVKKLTGGLAQLAKARKVTVINGTGTFTGPNELSVETAGGTEVVTFGHCIIAAGSEPARIPGLPDDPRVMDSTGALALEEVPERLLVIGGGIIGLEMATVYDALGSKLTVVEMMDQLVPGADPDLVKPLHTRIAERYEAIHVSTKVAGVTAGEKGLEVTFDGEGAPDPVTVDRILVAVGRRANGDKLGLDAAGVEVDDRGVIAVDDRLRTNVSHIHAIGDVVGNPMLAHKASHQGAVAAEVIAGEASAFDVRAIPAVAYTDPELAWAGLTETEAKRDGIEHEVAQFPWSASARALTMGRPDGRTKMIVEPGTRKVLGVGIVGVNAGELIAEAAHTLEMGGYAEDVALTVHPHPTLSETVMFTAQAAEGVITDLYLRGRSKK